MSMYEDSSTEQEPGSGIDAPAAPATTASGELIVPEYDSGSSAAAGGPEPATAVAPAPMKTTCFGVASAAGPLILCHFLHYNAWAIGNVPYSYVVNIIACEAHTNSACANSLGWQSVLGFLNPSVQFLFAKMFADLSDTHGRKPFLLVACCAIFFYGLFFALSTNMWLLLFGYTMEGIFAVGYSSGQAYMTDITTDSNGLATPNRAVSIAAYISVTQGATSLLGTLTALVMMEALGITPQDTMLAIVALAVVEVPMLVFLVDESLPVERRRPFDRSQANPVGVVRSIFQRDPFFSRMMISFALSTTGAGFLSATWVNFCDAAMGWGALGSSATIIIFGASMVVIPPPFVKAVGEVRAISLGYRIMIATYLVLVGIGMWAPYHGSCVMEDGSAVPDVPSITACRALPAVWADNLGADGAGCSDGISTNATACLASYLSPPPGYTNGLEWVTQTWTSVVVFIAPITCASISPLLFLSVHLCPPHLLAADGAGYMFDSGQRSYISKQVGETEQGALQGTLLSISLLTAAFSSFLSNLFFSFFLSDTFVEIFGQEFPGGQFLVSALCFTLAEWNTKHAFATPALSRHDRVQQGTKAAGAF